MFPNPAPTLITATQNRNLPGQIALSRNFGEISMRLRMPASPRQHHGFDWEIRGRLTKYALKPSKRRRESGTCRSHPPNSLSRCLWCSSYRVNDGSHLVTKSSRTPAFDSPCHRGISGETRSFRTSEHLPTLIHSPFGASTFFTPPVQT